MQSDWSGRVEPNVKDVRVLQRRKGALEFKRLVGHAQVVTACVSKIPDCRPQRVRLVVARAPDSESGAYFTFGEWKEPRQALVQRDDVARGIQLPSGAHRAARHAPAGADSAHRTEGHSWPEGQRWTLGGGVLRSEARRVRWPPTRMGGGFVSCRQLR